MNLQQNTQAQIKHDAFNEQKQLENIVAQAIEKARKKVDSVEVAINKSTGINISTRLGETENIEFNNDGALGITVYHQQRKGSASTNDLSPEAIEQAINMAINIMKYTSEDPCSGLGDKALMAFDAPDLDLFYPSDLDVEQGIIYASEAEKTALSHVGIKSSDGGYFASNYGIRVYGNSLGMLQGYCASSHSISCSVIGEKNGEMESNYAYTSARDMNELRSAQWVGQEAARRTTAHLGAKQIATMQVPVIFSADVATGLMAHFASAINGGAIYKKSSFLLDKIGQQIFPQWLTIEDKPHILKGVASSPFDRDGVKTQDCTIIQSGCLQTYLLSSYSARQLSTKAMPLQSTGHASGIYNWRLTSEKPLIDFEHMLKTMGTGIIVTSLMGQGVNMITGDYSRGASGFWVENGQIQYPINEFTVAGNLSDIYRNIVQLGNDIETRTNIQCGSILIDNMSIAGR